MFSEQHPGKDLQFCGDICQTVTHSCKLHVQVTHISKSQLLFQPWSLRLLQNYFLKCSSDVKLFYPEIVQHTADLQLKCTETEKNASLIELLQTPSYRLERNRVRDREIRGDGGRKRDQWWARQHFREFWAIYISHDMRILLCSQYPS